MRNNPHNNLFTRKNCQREKCQLLEKMRLSLQTGENIQRFIISVNEKNGNYFQIKHKDLAPSLRHSLNLHSEGVIPIYLKKETDKQVKITGLRDALSKLECKIGKIKNRIKENIKSRKSVLPRESQCSLESLQFLQLQFQHKQKKNKIYYAQQQDQKSTECTYKKESVQRYRKNTQNLKEKKQTPLKIPNFRKKNKTYYIQHAVKPAQTRNKLLSQHVTMSLKVFCNLLKLRSCSFSQIEQKKICIKKNEFDGNKKTLLLDLDETLIHCQEQPVQGKPHDIQIAIKLQNGDFAKAYIFLRPYVISFLKKMSKLYEIIVFTASHASYADPVLNQLDPLNELFRHRLYRQQCVQIYPNVFAKDLRIINRSIKDIVLVDNAPYSYIFQLQNGIPILPYYYGQDRELASLEKYLQVLAKTQDVRQMNKETFKLYKYCQFHEANQIIDSLYLFDS